MAKLKVHASCWVDKYGVKITYALSVEDHTGPGSTLPSARYRIFLVRATPCLRTCKCLKSASWELCSLCALGLPALAVCFLFSFTVGLYELCDSRVSEVLRNKVHRTEEARHVDFYAFSYYYDLAASFGLIGKGQANLGRGLASSDFVGTCEVCGLGGNVIKRQKGISTFS